MQELKLNIRKVREMHMDGRLEIAEKDWAKCESILREMPDYVTEWYLTMRASGVSAKSCKDYLNKVNSYLESIGTIKAEIKPEEFTSMQVNSYLISKQVITDSKGNRHQASKSYQQCLWSCLYNFFKYLESEEYIAKNPIKQNSRPTGNDLERINEHRILLTNEDFQKILNTVQIGCGSKKAQSFQKTMRNRDESIMRLFMCTGLRESALASINLDSIDGNGNLFIYDKGEVPHKFKITSECMDAIERWKKDREKIWTDSDALFISLKGNRITVNTITALVQKYTEAALGKALSPHKLRAGVCSILYKETGDIEFVRRFIGHSDTSITKRYIVTNKNEVEKGNEILERLIG